MLLTYIINVTMTMLHWQCIAVIAVASELLLCELTQTHEVFLNLQRGREREIKRTNDTLKYMRIAESLAVIHTLPLWRIEMSTCSVLKSALQWYLDGAFCVNVNEYYLIHRTQTCKNPNYMHVVWFLLRSTDFSHIKRSLSQKKISTRKECDSEIKVELVHCSLCLLQKAKLVSLGLAVSTIVESHFVRIIDAHFDFNTLHFASFRHFHFFISFRQFVKVIWIWNFSNVHSTNLNQAFVIKSINFKVIV